MNLFDDPFLCADGETIFELMLSKIDIGGRTSALNFLDRALKLRFTRHIIKSKVRQAGEGEEVK
jgi:hypothetical protein